MKESIDSDGQSDALKPWGDLVEHSLKATLDPARKGLGELSADVTTTSKLVLTF